MEAAWEVQADLERVQQDEVIQNALKQGMNLRDYAFHLSTSLSTLEQDALVEYEGCTGQFVDMAAQLQSCDVVLGRMQEMLLGFQADLSEISRDMSSLQDTSKRLQSQLQHRQAVEMPLAHVLQELEISDELINGIDAGEVNDVYLDYLAELHGKLQYVAHPHVDGQPIGQEMRAVTDLSPELDALKDRALGKIKEYLKIKIEALKKPDTNVKRQQETGLLKSKYLMTFLVEHAPQVGEEIRLIYVQTMSTVLSGVFRDYHTGLMKLVEETGRKGEWIAVDEQSVRSVFTSKVDLSKRSDAFALGKRGKVLESMAERPIVLFVAEQERTQYPFEQLFRSLQQHLMDSATHEYFFIFDFFQKNPRDIFMQIYAKTLSLCLENLENYLFRCYDAIGILLLIRITQGQCLAMRKRRVGCLDTFFDRVTCLLWPRFKVVFDMHLQSLRHANPKKMGAVELHPHYITRRYAEFAASIISLCGRFAEHGNGTEEMVLNNLALLRQEAVKLLLRMATQHQALKSQIVFLINNYDRVLLVFAERKIVSEETAKFEELLKNERIRFVEEELGVYYSDMIQLVRPLQADDGEEMKTPSVNEEEIHRVVSDFSTNWKSSIEQINANVMRYFSNFKNGTQILQEVLTQLLLYHTRLVDLVQRVYHNAPPFAGEMVSTQEMLNEIKKYCRSFE